MNQADSSRWFGQSNLSVVSLKETEDSTVSEFELVINEKNRGFLRSVADGSLLG